MNLLDNIRQNSLYFQYQPLHDFLVDIPFANGRYQDAQARASDPNSRVLGQRDLAAGRAHLWIRNRGHSWWNVVNAVPWGRLTGQVTVGGFQPGLTYSVEWWQFDDAGNLTRLPGSATAGPAGTLVFDLDSLPSTVVDVALKIGQYS